MDSKAYFLDIDGCIMEETFPTLSEERQTPETMKAIIDDVNEKGKKVKPYKAFSSFLFNHVTKKDHVYFITGRQRSAFGNLTYHQLYKYVFDKGNVEIIFYPENGIYTLTYYFSWKYHTIKKLLREECTHYIFDDNGGYFKDLLKLEDFDCECFLFNSNKDWKKFHRQIITKKKKDIELERTLDLLLLSNKYKFDHPLMKILDKIYVCFHKLLDFFGIIITNIEIYLIRKFIKKRKKS